jgi:histone H3/H4
MGAFAWSPLRALMKEAGAEIVARDAVDKLMDYLEGYAKNLTDCALDIAKHSGRKKVTADDMKIAIDLIND